MALQEQFERNGNWLFRWRSYLPLVMFGLFPLAFWNYKNLGGGFDADLIWDVFCLLVSFAGLGIRVYTVGYAPKGTSGRNVTAQVASVLNTTGMYSIVRHPLYLGNFLMWFGISLFFREWWFCMIVTLVYWLYYERIMFAEEAFLRKKFGDAFLEWAEATPAFIPDLRKWVSPSGTFSVRTVLKREQSGLMATVAIFTVLEVTGDYITDGKLEIESFWLIFFAAVLFIYITLSGLKKAKLL